MYISPFNQGMRDFYINIAPVLSARICLLTIVGRPVDNRQQVCRQSSAGLSTIVGRQSGADKKHITYEGKEL